MGVIRREETGERWVLPARALVGRGADCAVQVADRRVSGEHATLTWRDGHWELRDLASRNGTFVDGRALAPGERVKLGVDSRFSVGGHDLALSLVDVTGPGARATAADGTVALADGGVLLLPDAETSRLAIYADADGRWWLEDHQGSTDPAHDGQQVDVDGQPWTLGLPRELPPTVAATAGGLAVRFRVSLDEEHAEMVVVRGGTEHLLPGRSFTYLLLTLGRHRLADDEAGVSERERGWVLQETLAEELRLDPTTVGVYVHRARRQVGRLGDGVARAIIERRRGTRQLRLGLPVLRVDRG